MIFGIFIVVPAKTLIMNSYLETERKENKLYKNTKQIILFFEEVIAANLIWYKKGNVMYLNQKESSVCVFYDESIFRKI